MHAHSAHSGPISPFRALINILIGAGVIVFALVKMRQQSPSSDAGLYGLFIVFGVFVMLIGTVQFIVLRRKGLKMFEEESPARTPTSPASPPPVPPELAEFVRSSLADGQDKAAVRATLVAAGWDAAEVDRALS